jgi:translocation and assembly module TamB
MEVTTKAPTAKPGVKGAKNGPTPTILALRNDGPVTVVANPSGIEVQRAHWTGPSTDINVSGNVVLRPAVALNLNVAANADLAILKQIDRDISSEGNIVLNGSAKGPAGDPTLNGRLELKNAAFQTTTMPNGISKANGVVVLSGNSARIESFTAESGGGRVTAGGSVVRSNGTFVFNLNSRATNVMVRTDSGASVSANANVKLTGTTMNSLLSGNATIRSVGFTPRTDLGAILTTAGQPMETPGAPTGLMSGMKLDVDVRMAPGVTFRSPYAENLEAQADLNLRGTLENPGLLGRVSITQGELVFFGTKYTVNEGSVSFFNPNKIDPILNMNLETTARGVDVTLTVTGPVSNMNLSYQSDPPLQFSEIVGLLAVGRMPTSDPVLVAHQPATPQQSMQQMGESALLSAAVANPVSNQLERVFGVTQLKIDPTFTSGSELPQARLTLQQQVASNLTFTYVTDVSRTDPQIIRVEWAINPQWSAVASREQNGMVGVDLFYKRKFR